MPSRMGAGDTTLAITVRTVSDAAVCLINWGVSFIVEVDEERGIRGLDIEKWRKINGFVSVVPGLLLHFRRVCCCNESVLDRSEFG